MDVGLDGNDMNVYSINEIINIMSKRDIVSDIDDDHHLDDLVGVVRIPSLKVPVVIRWGIGSRRRIGIQYRRPLTNGDGIVVSSGRCGKWCG